MDSTFIAEEGVDEIARELGMSTQITAITQQAMEGKLDFNASFTRRIGMLKGTPKAVLNRRMRSHDPFARPVNYSASHQGQRI